MKFKKCSKCSLEKDVLKFAKDKNRTDGRYPYCKECIKKISRDRYLKNKESILKRNKKWKEDNNEYYLEQQRKYHKRWSQTIKGKFVQYKSAAKQRNYMFEISIKEFSMFWQNPCYYCDSPIETIGIDRINNDKGYIIENIVSCCRICNRAKDILKKEQYIEHCKKVTKKFGSNHDKKSTIKKT
jgi:hypothetical protein